MSCRRRARFQHDDVEHDVFRWRRIAVEEDIDQFAADGVECHGIGRVLQPRQSRLAHQVDASLGGTITGDLECRIGLERIDVIAILMPRRDHHRAGEHHGGVRVRDQQRIARVGDVFGDAGCDVELARDLAQHD